MFDIAVACLVLTVLLAYFNRRFVGLPTTIGVMNISMALSFALVGLDKLGFGLLRHYEQSLLAGIDFSQVLMQGMLSVAAPMALFRRVLPHGSWKVLTSSNSTSSNSLVQSS